MVTNQYICVGTQGKLMLKIKNHVGAWHCQKPLSRSEGFKSWAFAAESCQNTSSSVGFTKSRAFAVKSCQNISSSDGFTKSRAFAVKSCQNCANLFWPENEWWVLKKCQKGILMPTYFEHASFFQLGLFTKHNIYLWVHFLTKVNQ